MSILTPESVFYFTTDSIGNEYYCVYGSNDINASGTITIPSSRIAHAVAVGGGGGGYNDWTGGSGSGGFHFIRNISEGSYSYSIGKGGNIDSLNGESTTFSTFTAYGGLSGTVGGFAGGGGNGGGGGRFGGGGAGGGGGGNISGNIGNSSFGVDGGIGVGGGNGGVWNGNAGGGGATAVWGGAHPNGYNGDISKGGNGGGEGGDGFDDYGGGGGGGYWGGDGGGNQVGGKGYGGGAVSVNVDGGLGGGGGGFDARILYIYANNLDTNEFSWSSAALNNAISANAGNPTVFLSGITSDSTPIVPNPRDPKTTGNPGAIFIVVMEVPPTPPSVPCFVTGTQILTPTGYKPVEELQSGDYVLTAERRRVPIKLFSFTIANATAETAPYRIQAGTFGRNLPKRDLHLSARHAVKDAKGRWQMPKYLAKFRSTVTQYGIGKPVTYYHITCPNYYRDNLVAEEVVVESFNNKQTVGATYMWSKALGGWERLPPGKMTTIPKNPTSCIIFSY